MAESRSSSKLFSNPPVGKNAEVSGPGPLSVLKAREFVATWPQPTNDLSKLKSPPVVKRK